MLKRAFVAACIFLLCCCQNTGQEAGQRKDAKTTFQTSSIWKPTLDNRADAVMIYGVGGNPSDRVRGNRPSFEDRALSWKERGYETDFMTGIAWGSYQDYFIGLWDGEPHLDEGQVQANGDTIWHGRMVPYIVPTENYLKYFKERHVKRVIDAGIDDLYFEEPEFWNRAGYSEAFKREWKAYYNTDWRPQHESPEATYLSNKLKYFLYYRALDEVSRYAKEYGRTKGMEVRCYVPTHSLLNYSQWNIVSPEASLASLPGIDGYIAQVWTGTARTANIFNGKSKERTFETAFLEYGCVASMTEPTGRRVWFLTDPIEDWPRDWEDYRRNYHATFAAQLLYPNIADYEIMPWPERIYEGLYRKSADSEERIRIPKDYSTMMHVMINTLHEMPVTNQRLNGSQGIGIVMANSLMFQSLPTHDGYEDPQFSNFFGQAMPLLKSGIPVKIVHLENVDYKKTLADIRVLLLSYSNMKPMDPNAHKRLADWVKKGGIILYCGRDKDPFQSVSEWWNKDGNAFAAASDHLFALMGIDAGAPEGTYSYGKGTVRILRADPKEYVLESGAHAKLLAVVKELYEDRAQAGSLESKNHFYLERGPYTIVAVMNESVNDAPFLKDGVYIDLFDPQLPILSEIRVEAGSQGFFYDLSEADPSRPQILAQASRAYEEIVDGKTYSFLAKGPLETINASRILLPSKPVSVTVNGTESLEEGCWDENSHTYLLGFDNDPDGVAVRFEW
ncbi:MAG: hypothetical protein QM324_09830 [Bacteroidota bacterium]|nr:hypothetical protein [Bacteroidota bacterium]